MAAQGCAGPSTDEIRAAADDACANTLSRIPLIGPLWGEVPRRTQASRAIQLAGRLSELRGDLSELEESEDLAAGLDDYDGLLAEQGRALTEVNELTAPRGRVEANIESIDNGAGELAADLGLGTCANADSALQVIVREPSTG